MLDVPATTYGPELSADVPFSVRAGWYARWGKRSLDAGASLMGLVLISPAFPLLFCAAKFCSPGPVFYRQERVGKGGKRFRILKFRTMMVNAEQGGPPITAAGDPRVTKFGRLLRRFKLDELPQLWNVVKGEMSLVGPRPELPVYVAGYSAAERQVLSVRPGITDPASLFYRDEEYVLGRSSSPEQFYRETILPHKLGLNLDYLERMSPRLDLSLVLRTLAAVLLPQRRGRREAINRLTD